MVLQQNLLKIAETVQKLMEPEFECEIWNKNFFDLNQSTYDNLVEKAPSFDYAVFIGDPDDMVIRRNTGEQTEKKIAPRDNVYLEFALYAGILSAARSFFLLDEACGIASDLKGITMSYYADQEGAGTHDLIGVGKMHDTGDRSERRGTEQFCR